MDVIHNDIKTLTEKELKAANEKFPLFASMHEGSAVMYEEIQETEQELEMIHYHFREMWNCTRENDSENANDHAKLIRGYAEYLAVEAVQVAAMAQKFIDSERGVK